MVGSSVCFVQLDETIKFTDSDSDSVHEAVDNVEIIIFTVSECIDCYH